MAEVLAEFKFRPLRKKLLWNQATMMRLLYVTYCTLSEVRDYWRNKAGAVANGRGAWVALCAHPAHTDADTDTDM
jgi:hypothetical protein